MELADYSWYVVMTAPGAEHQAAVDLRRIGYRSLFLHTCEWTQGSAKHKSRLVKKPYLSRYVFVGLEPHHFVGDERTPYLRPVREARGVSSLVYSPGGEPLPVPLRAMELLTKDAELHSGEVFTTKKRRRFNGTPGCMVKLGEGTAYAGFMAEILSVEANHQITVEIEAFSRKVRAKVDVGKIDELLTQSGEKIEKVVTVPLEGPEETQAQS